MLIVFNYGLYSQCEYSQNSIDKFSKDRTIVTKPEKINYPSLGIDPVSFCLASIQADSITLYAVIIQIDNLDELICVNNDSKLYILTTDDDLLELKEAGGFYCSENGIGFFKFWIEKEDLEMMRSEHLSAVRLNHTDGRYDINVIGKDLQKVRGVNYFVNNVKCILNN